MFLELFLFAKNGKFLAKGGIHCIFRSSLGTFILCAALTEHDSSAADIIVHSMYVYVLLQS